MVSKRRIFSILILATVIASGLIIIPIVLFYYPKDGRIPDSGPYYHKIYHATSTDGINWTINNTILFDHASVPGAVYFNNSIYVYFVNAASGEKLSVAISNNNGTTFTIYDVNITGSNSPRPVDPNPIIDGGQIRLTYLGNLMMGGGEFNIVTASSDNGIDFIEDAVIYSADGITDPDLFQNATGDWILFVNSGSDLIKAIGSTPTDNFTEDTLFNFTDGWLCSTHLIVGKYYTYHLGSNGISVAEYNSSGLTVIETDLIAGFNGTVADPTVAVLGAGKYIMYFKQCTTC